MTKTERARLTEIEAYVETLMGGRGNGVTNADVIEAMLGDLARVQTGRAPAELAELVERDRAASEA